MSYKVWLLRLREERTSLFKTYGRSEAFSIMTRQLWPGLIIMEPLGSVQQRNFQRFMAEAGDLDVFGTQYPKMQMLTVPEMLDGRRFEVPGAVAAKGLAQQRILSPH